MDIQKEETYWHAALDLPKEQFIKTQVRPLRPGSFTYRDSFRHGTCQVSFFSVDTKMQLMAEARALLDSIANTG